MDVLFLVPPIDNNFLDFPQEFLGVCQIAAVLREKGYSAEVFQPHIYNMNNEQIIDVISRKNFRVLGITVMYNAIYNTMEIVKGLRDRGVKSLIVLGGYFPTLATEEVLEGCPGADGIMRGEGEETFVELMDRLDRGLDWKDLDGMAWLDPSGRCIINKPRPLINDVSSLPFPCRDNLRKIKLQSGFSYVMTSRGCYGDCLFCNIAAFFKTSKGSKWRCVEADRVVDEMEYLVKGFGMEWITIHDDNLLHPGKNGRERALKIAEEIKRRNLNIKFSMSCRTQDIEYELFSKLKEAGLWQVFIGVESMNQGVLDYLKKGTTVEENTKALEVLDNLWISVCTYFIMFNPESTMEEVKKDLHFLRDRNMRGFGDSINYRFNFNSINLDFGTGLAERLKDAPFVKRERFIYQYEIKDKKVEMVRRLAEYMMELCEEPCRYLYLDREWWEFNDAYNSLELLQINAVIEVIKLLEENRPAEDTWLKNTFGGLLKRVERIIARNEELRQEGKYLRYMPLYLFEEDEKHYVYDILRSEFIRVEGVGPKILDRVFDHTLHYEENEIRKVLEGKCDNGDMEAAVKWFADMKEKGYLTNYRELPAVSFDRDAALENFRRLLCPSSV